MFAYGCLNVICIHNNTCIHILYGYIIINKNVIHHSTLMNNIINVIFNFNVTDYKYMVMTVNNDNNNNLNHHDSVKF